MSSPVIKYCVYFESIMTKDLPLQQHLVPLTLKDWHRVQAVPCLKITEDGV